MSSLTMEPQEYLDSLAKPCVAIILNAWSLRRVGLATLLLLKCKKYAKTESGLHVDTCLLCGPWNAKKDDFEISPYPQSVTQAVFRALAAGVSGTATLSRSVGAHLYHCGLWYRW